MIRAIDEGGVGDWYCHTWQLSRKLGHLGGKINILN